MGSLRVPETATDRRSPGASWHRARYHQVVPGARRGRGGVGAPVAIVVLLASAPARSDVAPPRDYVESCTLEKASAPGEECILRTEWAFARAAPAYLAKAGFCKRCRTHGATYAGVMYCRPRAGAEPLPANWEKTLPQDPAPPTGPAPNVPACPLPDAPRKPQDGRFATPPDEPRAGCACGVASRSELAPASLLAAAAAALAMRVRRRRRRGARADAGRA
jgi:hypothetical protein